MTMFHPKLGLCIVEDTFLFGIFSIVSVSTIYQINHIVLTKRLLKPIRIVKE